jgi:riboflavin synthase
VIAHRNRVLQFDVLRETWERTNLQFAQLPEKVNLETALRFGDPIGGHFVTGHVDEVGCITGRKKRGRDMLVEIKASSTFMKWILLKGSVAIDGVSLTVAKVTQKSFGVWVIPHTLKCTTLGWKNVGDRVNLEGDMLAKYAQKLWRR